MMFGAVCVLTRVTKMLLEVMHIQQQFPLKAFTYGDFH